MKKNGTITVTDVEVAKNRVRHYTGRLAEAKSDLQDLERRLDAERCVGVVFGAGRGTEYTYLVPEGWFMPVVGDKIVVPEPYGAYRNYGEQIVTVVSVGQRNYFGNLRTMVGRVERY